MDHVRTTYHSRAYVQPLLQWKSRKYYICWVCVCSLTYPACNAHASYCRLWPDRHYIFFSHYLIHGSIFEKLLDIKYVFWFYLQLAPEIFLITSEIKEIWSEIFWSSCTVTVILLDFNETWIFSIDFREMLQ